MNHRLGSIASLASIALILVLGVGYLAFGVVQVRWPRTHLTATMTLAESGGLLPNSKVLLSGIEVGKVTGVRHVPAGVTVTLDLDDRYRVPATGSVSIANLSGLGEPYLEFVPTAPNGPYLHDGQAVAASQVSLPVSMPTLAEHVTTVLQQLDPEAIGTIIGTFTTAFAGTEAVMPQLARSTNLLAATMLSRTGSIRTMLVQLQHIADDMSWAGPDLSAAAGPWREFGPRVQDMIAVLIRSAHIADGPAGFLVDTPDSVGLVPFIDRLSGWIKENGPAVAQLTPAMQPVISSATGALGNLDLGALIEQALAATSPDGALRLQLNVK